MLVPESIEKFKLLGCKFYSGDFPFHFARNLYHINSYTKSANNMIVGFAPLSYTALKITLPNRTN